MTKTLLIIPTLTTDRLTLRAPQLSDFDTYAEFYASDRSKGVGGPYDRDRSFNRLCEVAGHWLLREYGRWLVADIATNQPLGIVGLMYPCHWPEPELAWTVFEDGEGKGIAFEAALASRRYAYEVLGWKTVISCTTADNQRSIALAKRMGSIQEPSYQHPSFGELYVWRHPSSEVVQ